MARLLLGAGKKKKIQAVANFYKDLERKGKVGIYAIKIKTKRVLVWDYDEIKLLFEQRGGQTTPALDKLLRDLDTYSFRDQTQVAMDFEGEWSGDKMIKINALSACRAFIGRGVTVKIDLEEKRETDYRIYYRCVGRLKGPADDVIACKRELEKEKVCVPDKIRFLF